MKAEKKLPELIKHDIVLTLTPEEAKALFHIIEDFGEEGDLYYANDVGEQFDVTLHSVLLELGLGVNRE